LRAPTLRGVAIPTRLLCRPEKSGLLAMTNENMTLLLLLIFLIFPNSASADTGHIVISEIQVYGQAATDEFVRLYNPTGSAIDISGWKLAKKTSSGTESNLVSSFPDGTTISANSYFLITHKTDYQGNETANATYSGASYSIAANNTVILKNADGAVIDKVGFGTAADYENAPADNPENGASIKRYNNEDTGNNKKDFSAAAAQTAQKNSATSTATAQAGYGDIVINEVMPNPAEEKEWIEFFNATENDLDVSGWKVKDGRDGIYTLSGAIAAKSFLTIEVTNRLNNSGDAIYLSDTNNYSIHQLAYGNWNDGNLSDNPPAPEKGQSVARQTDGNYAVTSLLTKNQKNNFLKTDNETIKQLNNDNDYGQIIISEIMPNPEGADTKNEYIKLYNNGSNDTDIGGLYLDDDEGGNKPYYIPKDTIIKSQNYLIFYSAKTKISLNNRNDIARLLDKNKEELQAIEYDDAEEGAAYVFKNNKWKWADSIKTSSSVIPAKAGMTSNSITGIVIVPPNTFNKTTMYIDGRQLYMYNRNWPDLKVGDKIRVYGTPSAYYGEPRLKISSKNNIVILSRNNPTSSTAISNEEIEDENVGKLVTIQGEVIEISSQKISLDLAGAEILVYKKPAGLSFSNLKERDVLKIIGILSKYKDDYRLLPRDNNDIEILNRSGAEKAVDKLPPFWQYLISTLTIGALTGSLVYLKRRRK